MLTARRGSGVATVTKGIIWEGQRHCVGPSDAPTARKHLRLEYPHEAQRARVPKEVSSSSGSSFATAKSVSMNGKVNQ